MSVETGSGRDVTLKAKAEQGLTYRSWWDGTDEEGPGPIATAWNAGGFPAVYVLDGKGVIRFVDARHEDLLKAVRQLLTEHMSPSRNWPLRGGSQARPLAARLTANERAEEILGPAYRYVLS